MKSGGVCSRYGAFATFLIDFVCNLINVDNLDLYVFPQKGIQYNRYCKTKLEYNKYKSSEFNNYLARYNKPTLFVTVVMCSFKLNTFSAMINLIFRTPNAS